MCGVCVGVCVGGWVAVCADACGRGNPRTRKSKQMHVRTKLTPTNAPSLVRPLVAIHLRTIRNVQRLLDNNHLMDVCDMYVYADPMRASDLSYACMYRSIYPSVCLSIHEINTHLHPETCNPQSHPATA